MILLTGFYGEGNLGDEAILEGLLRTLPSTVSLAVTAGREGLNGIGRRFGSDSPSLLGNRVFQTLPRRGFDGFAAFLSALPRARAVVMSGGILQDWSVEGVSFWALRLFAARLFRRPAFLLGCGLGPLRSTAACTVTRKALQAVTEAWLRDSPSFDLYRDLGGRHGFLGTDFSWAIPVSEPTSAIVSAGIGINLRPWGDPVFAQLAHRDRQNYPGSPPITAIVARAEDARPWREGPKPHWELIPGGFADLVSGCRVLAEGWAMRYHVVLAMLRAGIPVRALCYDDKVLTLARAAGLVTPGEGHISGTARRVPLAFLQEQRQRLEHMQAACRERWR